MPNLSYIRTEIERMRVQVSRQPKEILQLQRSGISTASAVLLVRMHAKIDQLRSSANGSRRSRRQSPRSSAVGAGNARAAQMVRRERDRQTRR